MQKESIHLDVSRRSYGVLKREEFCSKFLEQNCSNFEQFSVLTVRELDVVIDMKVVDISLRVPTTLRLPNLEVCNSSYKFLSKDSCCCNPRTDC